MAIEVVRTIPDIRAYVSRARERNAGVGFVPTMGALHDGHAALIERARGESDRVIVSIFVNPTQFDRPDDLEQYPRTLDRDVALCASRHADVVFAPTVEEMYPRPLACTIDIGHLGDHLCGQFRPGHFRGMATVVMKLLQIVQPRAAYFGEKDAQQLAIVRRLVGDFDVPVDIVGVPTVREADGLALSSRNERLTPDERRLAPVLYTALRRVESLIAGGATDAAAITREAADLIPRHESLRLEYLDLVEPTDFQPVPRVTGPVVAAGALWVGHTRLIDNILCLPGVSQSPGAHGTLEP